MLYIINKDINVNQFLFVFICFYLFLFVFSYFKDKYSVFLEKSYKKYDFIELFYEKYYKNKIFCKY